MGLAELAKQPTEDIFRLLNAEKALHERAKRMALEGTLIDLEAARQEWQKFATLAARELRNMGKNLAGRLLSSLGIAPTAEKLAEVRKVLDHHADQVAAALSSDRFGGAATVESKPERVTSRRGRL